MMSLRKPRFSRCQRVLLEHSLAQEIMKTFFQLKQCGINANHTVHSFSNLTKWVDTYNVQGGHFKKM